MKKIGKKGKKLKDNCVKERIIAGRFRLTW